MTKTWVFGLSLVVGEDEETNGGKGWELQTARRDGNGTLRVRWVDVT